MNNDDGDNYRDEMLDNRSAMQSLCEAQRQLDKLNAKLAAVTSERDRLAEAFGSAIRNVLEREMADRTNPNWRGRIANRIVQQALAAVKQPTTESHE